MLTFLGVLRGQFFAKAAPMKIVCRVGDAKCILASILLISDKPRCEVVLRVSPQISEIRLIFLPTTYLIF